VEQQEPVVLVAHLVHLGLQEHQDHLVLRGKMVTSAAHRLNLIF